MISRAQWKKIRPGINKGIPEGERTLCKHCGGAMVLESKQDSIIIHHAFPYCPEFEKLCDTASFLTLSETKKIDIDKFIEELKKERN
jgi:hypothetical protein